jgi:cell wall-associated NlpC family hydrolase
MRGGPVLLIAGCCALLALGSAMLVGLVLLAGSGGALAGRCAGEGVAGGGAQQTGPRSWSAEQTDNAQTITQVAAARGLPRRAAVIAVSAAIVESQLRNVDHGDRDSLGLFQQRPSQGWGPPAELLNPVLAAGKFYEALLTVPRWIRQPPGVAAQAVQRSAYPHRYAPAETAAAALVGHFWVGPDQPAPGTGVEERAAARLTLACQDQGGAELPAGSGPAVDPARLPPGFTLPTDPLQRDVVAYALEQVGKPYVWGAKGPAAFDCSGLTQAAWAAAGVPISAGTVNQISDGTPVAERAQLSPGDLLFIPGSFGTAAVPRHVGLYVGDGLVVDARNSRRGVILSSLADWDGDVVAVRHIGGPPGPATPASAGAP